MAEQAPEHQDRGLFGLLSKKEEEGVKHDDQIMQPPATHTHNEAQTEAASYYPAAPQHGVEHCQGHGHDGQLTPEEAELQKHTGLMGKLHRTHSSSSSSSSDEEEEGRKKKEAEKKKKGAKDKIKEKLPGIEQHSSDQCADEGEKKAGLLDKIKEKLPGQHNKKDGEEEEKLPGVKHHSSDQCADEGEKKAGLLDKIKEKLPGHQNKKDGAEEEKKHHN